MSQCMTRLVTGNLGFGRLPDARRCPASIAVSGRAALLLDGARAGSSALKIAPLMQLSVGTLANLALRQVNTLATVGRIRANDMQWRLQRVGDLVEVRWRPHSAQPRH